MKIVDSNIQLVLLIWQVGATQAGSNETDGNNSAILPSMCIYIMWCRLLFYSINKYFNLCKYDEHSVFH